MINISCEGGGVLLQIFCIIYDSPRFYYNCGRKIADVSGKVARVSKHKAEETIEKIENINNLIKSKGGKFDLSDTEKELIKRI